MAFRSITVDLVSGFPTGYIIVALYDPSAPGAPVAYQSFARPGQNPGEVIFNGVNDIVYEIRIYQNNTAVPGGTLLRSYVMDEKFSTGSSRDDLYLIAGSTTGMDVGARSYSITGDAFIDPSLVGWTYSLERKGEGTLLEGVDYTIDQTTNGWQLVDAAYQFGNGEVYIMHFQAIIVSAPAPNTQSSGVLFQNVVVISADTTLNATTHFGNFVILQGANPVLNIGLPASNTVSVGKLICLMSEGGNQTTVNLFTTDGTSFAFLGKSPSALFMGQGETLWVFFDGTNWRVAYKDGNWNIVGEIIQHYATTELNTLQCAGQAISKTQYARLWQFVSTEMAGSQLVTDAVWNYQNPTTLRYDNHGKFSNIDANTFRLPVLYAEKDGSGNITGGSGFLRGVDGVTRKPGDQEYDAVGNFGANLTGTNAWLATASSPANAVTLVTIPPGSGVQNKGNQVSNSPILFSGQTEVGGVFTQNNESRPADTGVYMLIRY